MTIMSIVIPVYNEVESLPILMRRISAVMDGLKELSFEVLFIDDGSSDGSTQCIKALQQEYGPLVRAVYFRKNCGKSAALHVGFRHARGELVVMMDADLQDQPEEITKLIEPIMNDSLDAVTGWKVNRNDPLDKTIPSKFFNMMIRKMSGLDVHDINCGLKAFRRECLESVKLYGGLHRFLLILVADKGFRVGEVPVEHAPRAFGVTKYGAKRFFHGLMDILTVYFMTRFTKNPLYFFGSYGLTLVGVSLVMGFYFASMHALHYFFGVLGPEWHIANHPLWVLSPFAFIVGLIFLFFGLIAEMINAHSFSHDSYQGYIIREKSDAADE